MAAAADSTDWLGSPPARPLALLSLTQTALVRPGLCVQRDSGLRPDFFFSQLNSVVKRPISA